MTTPNHTTRGALHGQLDALLTPHRTAVPEPPAAGQADTGSLVDELQGVLDTTAAARCALAARSSQAGTSLSEAGAYDADLYESLNESLEAFSYDPMPTKSDPWGFHERMDELEAAHAARSVPRQAPLVDPQAAERTANLTEAQRRIEAIFD